MKNQTKNKKMTTNTLMRVWKKSARNTKGTKKYIRDVVGTRVKNILNSIFYWIGLLGIMVGRTLKRPDFSFESNRRHKKIS
jgi:hypothetical protein